MTKINDINSLKEFERIPNPELISDDDLFLVETENGELKSVKYKDLGEGISKDGIIGDTGPVGPKGDPGIEIVKEGEVPSSEDTILWIQEGESPDEDIASNIQSYLGEIFMCGDTPPTQNPYVTANTLLYFQIDDNLPESNIRFLKVPNDQSDMQKQIDALQQKFDKLPEVFVQSEGYNIDFDPPPATPDYTEPKVILESDINEIEIGSSISPTISIKYFQNDAGNFKLYRLYINDKLQTMSYDFPPSTFTINPFTILSDVKIKVEVEYLEGPVKDNSLYNNIPEGYVSGELCIKVGLPYWNFATNLKSDPNEVTIRNSKYQGVNLTKSSSLKVKSDITKNTIIFAYPKKLGECEEINYVGFDIYNKDAFTFTEISITLANNIVIPYYVYFYRAPIEIGSANFILTI